ncbi:MAG: hypothetical protein HC802_12785 [Caldilineaceae bacterium]|nr:hypothetical protein [Caldilineaceae bacterium]
MSISNRQSRIANLCFLVNEPGLSFVQHPQQPVQQDRLLAVGQGHGVDVDAVVACVGDQY